MSKEQKETLNRFTTLINPTLLSNIKLVSYFTNQKLYESLEMYFINTIKELPTSKLRKNKKG